MAKLKWILGLTGGIASGKTTVSAFFKKFGCQIIDADIVAREIVKPNTEGLEKIKEAFGNKILQNDGTLNRRALKEIIFTDNTKKTILNNILHPIIRKSCCESITLAQTNQSNNIPYVIFSAPLLFENHLEFLCNYILCMKTDVETQINRTMERDHCNRDIAINIVHSQYPLDTKISLSDEILESNLPKPEMLEEKVLELHKRFLTFDFEGIPIKEILNKDNHYD
ncbi:MAG: dephospho-CoA kinase [Succinivibrionaceae bacterium]